jgi:predicted membrane protein (TIGR00267 family)
VRAALAAALRDESVRAVSRRYFVSNGFDGALTAVGVVVGAVTAGVPDGGTVLGVGAGAAVGLATSGVWSVREIERAETRADLRRVERAMLADLSGTHAARRRRVGRALSALASGLGPVVGVFLPVSPFALEGRVLTMAQAGVAGVVVASAVLFLFGVYLGRRAGGRPLVAGARMGLAGLVVAALTVLLPG